MNWTDANKPWWELDLQIGDVLEMSNDCHYYVALHDGQIDVFGNIDPAIHMVKRIGRVEVEQ